jgi:hypothetical protein
LGFYCRHNERFAQKKTGTLAGLIKTEQTVELI